MIASEISSPTRKPSHLFLARILLAVLVLVVFGQSVAFEFNYHDDNVNTYGNPHLNPPSLAGLHHFWTGGYVGLFIPVTYTFWAFLAQLSALLTGGVEAFSPVVFHGANILVHLVSVLLVLSILRRLLTGPRSFFAAFAGAALFAIHPLQVEPVAWVTGMKDLLSGALSLGAVLAYLRCLPSATANGPASPRIDKRFYTTATILFAAAVLAKPSAVAVPVILALLELGFVENASWKRALRLLAPWTALAVLMVVLAKQLQPQNSGFVATPLWFRPLVMLDAAGFYLRQTLWPAVLSSDYGRSPGSLFSSGPWRHLGWFAIALLAAALAFPVRRKQNLCHVAIFGAALLPYSGLVPFAFQVQSTVADRYAYLVLFVAALALGRLLLARPGKFSLALALLTLTAFSFRAATHLSHFENEETVYRHSLDGNPHSAHIRFNLANTLRNDERFDEAAEQYRILIESHSDFAAPYVNLAAIHSAQNEYAKAEKLYGQAIELKGQFEPFAHHGLAMSLAARGSAEEADAHFRESIALDPANQSRYIDWARALESQDRHADAAVVYNEAARHTAAPIVFHRMAAQAWHAAGDVARCQSALHRILGENPQDIFAMNLLAWIRATAADTSVRNGAEAVRLAESVCALTQFSDPAALDTLAAAYAATDRFDEALKTLSKMVDVTRNLSAEDFERAGRVFDRRAAFYRREQALSGPTAKPFLEVAAQ